MYTQLLKLRRIPFFLILFLMIFMVSCTSSDKPAKYRFYLRGDNSREEQIIEVDDLSKGFINPRESGVVLNKDIYYDFYYHKGTYYDIDHPRKIKKYNLQAGKPVFQDSCIIANMDEIETHSFVGDNTLLIVGLDTKHRNPVYAIINTNDFKVEKEGNIPIPDDGTYQRTSVGFAVVKNNKLYINYVYHNLSKDTYTTSDSISLVTLDYPQMTPRHNSSSDKSTYTPKNGRHQPTMAFNAQGEIFFITNTSDAFGKMDNLPSGIMKVNMINESLNNNFFINISDTLKHCYPVAIWFVTKNTFLVKCERQDLVNSWNDYLDRRVFEYYSINVSDRVLNKLDIPLDAPWYTNNVIVDNGIAYIANNAEDGYTFWVFDPINNSLRKGLKVDTSVKRIFSIDFN